MFMKGVLTACCSMPFSTLVGAKHLMARQTQVHKLLVRYALCTPGRLLNKTACLELKKVTVYTEII